MDFGDHVAGFHLQPGRTERTAVRPELGNLFLISRIEADEVLALDFLDDEGVKLFFIVGLVD